MAIMCFCIWYFEGIQWQPCAQEKIVWATASKLLFPLHLTSANLPVIAITRHTPLPHTISMMYHTIQCIPYYLHLGFGNKSSQKPLDSTLPQYPIWSNILPTKALNTAKKINKLTTDHSVTLHWLMHLNVRKYIIVYREPIRLSNISKGTDSRVERLCQNKIIYQILKG